MVDRANRSNFKWRLAIIAAASLLFGAMMSVIKGNDAGLRDAIGNVCAPWLLLPYLASIFARKHSLIPSALVGLLSSSCALIGFYLSNSFVLDLGPHPWLVKLALTLRSGLFYYMLNLISGPVCGAMGGWYTRSRSITPAMVMALLFVLEPITWKFYDYGGFHGYPIVSNVEMTIGVIACIVLIIRFKLSRLR